MTLRLDYSNMMISPGGIDQKSWTAAGKQFGDAKRGFDQLRAGGTVGFVELGGDRELLDQVEGFAAKSRGKFDDVVLLGICRSRGGPSLLCPPRPPPAWGLF